MAADHYEQRVRAVTDYVRANLTSDLRLGELSAVAHFSPYHFHRIFATATGETLARFVRRARLERALYLMKSSPSKSLGSIAVASGFSTHSDFSRVFRSEFGIAPSSWDRVQRLTPTEIEPDEVLDGPRRFGQLDRPPEMMVRHHGSARIAYVRVRDPWRGTSLATGYELLTTNLCAVGFDWKCAPMIGMSWDSYDATDLGQVTFDIGFEVDADTAIDDGSLGVIDLPAMRSINAHSDGPMIRIAQTWDYLYLDWLPGSGFEPANLPAIKRFHRRPDETGWEHWDVDCCLALRTLTP